MVSMFTENAKDIFDDLWSEKHPSYFRHFTTNAAFSERFKIDKILDM
jgi:hypothetical protein